MAKPNFSYQKRQKELAKKAKKEEKRLKKLKAKLGPDAEEQDQDGEVKESSGTWEN